METKLNYSDIAHSYPFSDEYKKDMQAYFRQYFPNLYLIFSESSITIKAKSSVLDTLPPAYIREIESFILSSTYIGYMIGQQANGK